MHRSCCIRFCQYLQEDGINDFCEITTHILQDFNCKDIHTTPEGKAAYNCRISFFLIYLYEQGMVCNPYLYKALPTMSAPRTVIVQTLSPEDMVPQILICGFMDPSKKQPGQRRKDLGAFLKSFQGFIHTDAYKGYEKVPGVARYFCWLHLRRYFVDALPKGVSEIFLPGSFSTWSGGSYKCK